MNFLENVSIDSLKVRIPIDQVDILNLEMKLFTMTAKVEVDKQTGAIDVLDVDVETMKNNSLLIQQYGVSTRYLIQKKRIRSELGQEFLFILLNSKILGKDYLQGINADNIGKVYKALIDQQVVHFSFEDFLKSFFTDTDIKADFKTGGLEHQMQLVDELGGLTKSSIRKDSGHTKKRKSDNIGIQWSKREIATNSNPHLKVYAKDIELQYNSKIFADHYNIPIVEGLTRIEGTIKNNGHWNYLTKKQDNDFINDNTLQNLLGLDQTSFKGLLKTMAKNHLDIDKGSKKGKDNWTLSKSSSSLAIELGLMNKMSINVIKEYAQKHNRNRNQYYKHKQLLDEVYNDVYKGTKEAEYSEAVAPLFNMLGIGETDKGENDS